MNDTACNMIHDSSVCCPTLLNYNSHNLSYTAHDDENYKDLTEGYYVQVFDDRTIFYGENLYYDKIYPSACYVIEGCRTSYENNSTEESSTIQEGVLPKTEDLRAYGTQLLDLPKSFSFTEINSTDLNSLIEKSKDTLETFYPFSSYNAYQALKSAVKNADKSSTTTAYKELATAYANFLPYTYSGEISLYFVNTKGWDNVYAHLWSAKNDTTVQMEQVGTNDEGYSVYKVNYNYNMYKQVVFGDGGDTELTEEQTLSGIDKQMFTANIHDPKAPYFCLNSVYGQSDDE
jgi:hypothetical protein